MKTKDEVLKGYITYLKKKIKEEEWKVDKANDYKGPRRRIKTIEKHQFKKKINK